MTDMAQTESETLARRLSRGPLDSRSALDILEQLLEALAVVHATGAIHGGINPENIVLSPGGQAELVGFGPSEEGDESARAPGRKATPNPGYSAPEQIVGDPVDARADVFAVAVVAYEMLTGKNLFGVSDGVPVEPVMFRTVYRPQAEIPHTKAAGLPRHVVLALDAALERDPHDRFADAQTFLDALKDPTSAAAAAAVAAASSRSTPSIDPSPVSGALATAWLWLTTSGRKWVQLSLAAGLVVVVLAIVLLLVGNRGPSTGAAGTSVASGSTTTTATTIDDSSATTSPSTIPPSSSDSTAPSTTTTTALSTTTVIMTASVTLSGLSNTYSGSAHRASATTNPSGLPVVITYRQSGRVVSAPVNAGTYSVTATISDPNYQGSTTDTLTIAKAHATVSLSGLSVTYNGSARTASATTNPSGLLVVKTHSPVSAPVNAGTYSVTATISNPNYQGSSTGTLTIAKATATFNIAGWSNTYDGSSHGASGTATGVGGAGLSAGLSYGTTYIDVPGGPGNWTFTGGTNYNNASGSVAIVIGKANASISVSGWTGDYDGTSHGASGTATGVLGENLSSLLDLGSTYINVPGGPATWTFSGNTNYNSDSGSVSIVINEVTTTTVAP